MVLDYSPKNKMTTHKSLLMRAVMRRSTSGVEFQATYAGPHPAKQHPGQGAGPGEDMGGAGDQVTHELQSTTRPPHSRTMSAWGARLLGGRDAPRSSSLGSLKISTKFIFEK